MYIIAHTAATVASYESITVFVVSFPMLFYLIIKHEVWSDFLIFTIDYVEQRLVRGTPDPFLLCADSRHKFWRAYYDMLLESEK